MSVLCRVLALEGEEVSTVSSLEGSRSRWELLARGLAAYIECGIEL